MASDATAWAYSWRNFGGFYSAPYANKTLVTGSATGNTFGFQGSTTYAAYDQVLVIFAVVDGSGNHTADTSRYVVRNGLSGAMAAYAIDLSSLSVTVPAGSRLAILFYYYDYAVGEVNHRIAYDNYGGAITNQVTLLETVLDTFPPTWNGGVSGITAQDDGADGVLRVSWNNATDPGLATTPPVLYDLYRVQSAACTGLWDSLNLYRSNLGSTSFQDSGLANGLTYCFGVRAKDSSELHNATSNDAQTATATPSRGAAFGCNSCHASPPVSAGNAGSHAAHANSDARLRGVQPVPPRDGRLHEQPPGRRRTAGVRRHGRHRRLQRQPALLHRQRAGDLQRHQRLRHPHRERRRRDRQRDLRRHAVQLLSRFGDARLGRRGDLRLVPQRRRGNPRPGRHQRHRAHNGARGRGRRLQGLPRRSLPGGADSAAAGQLEQRQSGRHEYADPARHRLHERRGDRPRRPGHRGFHQHEDHRGRDLLGVPRQRGHRERVGLQHENDPGRIPRRHLRDRRREPGIGKLRLDLHLRRLHRQDGRLDAGVLDVRVRPAREKTYRIGAHGELRRRRSVLERRRQRPRERDRRADLPDPGAQGGDPLLVLPRRRTTPSAPPGSPTCGAAGRATRIPPSCRRAVRTCTPPASTPPAAARRPGA